MRLFDHQLKLKADVYDAWNQGAQNVLMQLATGGGKTVIGSDIIRDTNAPTCSIAHRQELVTQISLALARDGVSHRIIGPDSVIKLAAGQHMAELGRMYIDQTSRNAVAGVDTLIRRTGELARWANTVQLWWQDEGHHVLKNNKWGQAAAMFPNARGLLVTATPIRADGAGLGRHVDGLADLMVQGPSMRDLINWGYLTDYRIFCPPSDFFIDDKLIGKSGDWSTQQRREAAKNSHIVGDVVAHYLRIAPGKLGVTFATDVETATDIAAQFNAAGVPAAVVSAKTTDADRIRIIQQFRRRELLQLVNVDLFGEGFDLPAIEVVSMARPTQSYALYAQQFGRALRTLDGKLIAIIIDHVGNVKRHGLPDAPRVWTLDRRERRGRSAPDDAIPLTTCLNLDCMAVYERVHNRCPFCGFKPEPSTRSGPEFVDGDLAELDQDTLAKLRGEAARIDGPVIYPNGLPGPARIRLDRIHRERQTMQQALRSAIAWWAQYHTDQGCDISETQRRFYFAFGVDVMTAQTLNYNDALKLAERVSYKLGELTA